MAGIERTATGEWRGDLKTGEGLMDGTSGTLHDMPFTYVSRFESGKGTNPEELIAAAHAGCYSMAFTSYLNKQGYSPTSINTEATVTLENGAINKMHLVTHGQVAGVDEATFKRLAEEAEKQCPVSNLLRNGLEITLDASLDD